MTHPTPKVKLTDMTPYMGRFVRFTLVEEHELPHICGFLTSISSGKFEFDDTESVAQKHVVAAYNIVGKKIAGEGPEEFRYGST